MSTTTDQALELMKDFKIWDGTVALYTATIGSWWLIPLYLVSIFGVSVVTRSEAAISVYIGITSALCLYYEYFPTYFEPFLYIFLVFSIAVVLFKMFGTE